MMGWKERAPGELRDCVRMIEQWAPDFKLNKKMRITVEAEGQRKQISLKMVNHVLSWKAGRLQWESQESEPLSVGAKDCGGNGRPQ